MEIDFDSLEDRQLDPNSAELHPDTARVIAELDRKNSARRLAVPTRDPDVRLRLREMGQPTTLFGERPEDRRDRLRALWSQQRQDAAAAGGGDDLEDESDDSSDSDSDEEKEEEFYTEGTKELKVARRDIAEFSLDRLAPLFVLYFGSTSGLDLLQEAQQLTRRFSSNRAKKRLARQRLETSLPLSRLMDVRRSVFNDLKTFSNLGSQIGDTRALSSLRFSPDSSMLLTSSWTGTAKLWSVPACKEIKTIRGKT